MKKINLETVVGGVFGLLAVLSAVGEMALSGFSLPAVIGGVKDISGTMVVVMVFLVAIRGLLLNSPKNLSQELDVQMVAFEKRNKPLIFRVSDFQPVNGFQQGFSILTEPSEFLSLSGRAFPEALEKNYSSRWSRKTGKFVDLPENAAMLSGKFELRFNFIGSTNYGRGSADFVDNTVLCINSRFAASGYPARKIDKTHFAVEIPQIATKEDISSLFDLLEFILTLYKIQA